MTRDLPNTKSIVSFITCAKCFNEMPPGQSMETWSRINVGFTVLGLQIWCARHDCNIAHIDFEGQKHPANTSRARDKNGR